MIISRSVLLTMKNVSENSCTDTRNKQLYGHSKQTAVRTLETNSCTDTRNIYFMFNNYFFFEDRAVKEIMWKNTVEQGRPQMTIWRMRIVFCIPKTTNTLRLCNSHYFSTATMVARTLLDVTLNITLADFPTEA